MAKTTEVTKKVLTAKNENDIFTAMLGLAVLVVAATIVYACLRSMTLFGKIF